MELYTAPTSEECCKGEHTAVGVEPKSPTAQTLQHETSPPRPLRGIRSIHSVSKARVAHPGISHDAPANRQAWVSRPSVSSSAGWEGRRQ